ncbi:BRCA1-associated RING domain protein 1 [Klebsormidium nitens]|uniref:BRCA1-associated RING domain protein 1 n=1 Tax=Klebsormidium nitens TaxID=105231 RepID=A0A1Y1I1D2_KLENI|nr:BRCA1-associated RING domain protein 1 [Klebsormidium nitens]|eukprot:GAQ82577.1 BRCA1-associated RING domain protein 1 [Klebsormidium nitens]
MQAESVLKLGKELTCPICLGLLKSAVHLACNHCFCRGCIQQSILTKASCPVCKKPAHKRDLRPAASVDQVVAAYAEMERALGVQILCSQPAKPPPQDDNEEEAQGKRKKPKSKMQKIAEEGKENEVPRANARAEKLGKEARGLSAQESNAFKTPKNGAKMGQGAEKPGDAKLSAGLVACGGSKQSLAETEVPPPESSGLAAGKAKKKSAKKKAGGKLAGGASAKLDALDKEAALSPPLPALAESAPTSDQRGAGFSPGGSGFQPFFWMGGQVGTQDPEGGTQLRPTQASPPMSFSDLVSSGKKGAMRLKEGAASPGELVSREIVGTEKGAKAANKGRKARGKGAGKEDGEKVAREEFYSCEDDTPFDAFLQEDGLGVQEASLPPSPSTKGEAKGVQKKGGKGKKGGSKQGAKEPKRNAVEPKGEEAAVSEKGKLKAEIRASVAAAVGLTKTASGAASHVARLAAEGEGKVTSAEEGKVTSASEHKPKQRAAAAGKRKRGIVAGPAAAGKATGVSAEPTAVSAAAAPSTTPHVSKKPAGEGGKTPSVPAKTPGDTGLCPSTSRPPNSGGPPVFCEKPVCGFCGLGDDSSVAGKLVRKGAAQIGLLAAEGFEERGADNESGGKRKRVQLASVVVHELCAQWAPNVFFEGEELANLDSELARSRQLKCSVCSRRGAALGCFLPRCRHTYHYACSRQLEGCRFDEESYVMLCPDHSSEKLPFEMEIDEFDGSDQEEAPANGKDKGGAKKRKAAETARGPKRAKTAPSVQATPASMKWAGAPGTKWVLTGSGLSPKEKDDLALLAHSSGAQVVKDWSPAVTHVITGVDEKLRSKRTLKYLTAVLTGQWVVTPEWVTESLALSQPAKEASFEVLGDAQNETGGPKKGRMAARKGAAPLFDGIDFFLSGDWPGTPSKADMAAVVSAGGGTVLARRPLPNEAAPAPSSKSHKSPETVILYFGGQPAGADGPPGAKTDAADGRRAEALGLSGSAGKGSVVVHHRWLLDSASAFQLQDSSKY